MVTAPVGHCVLRAACSSESALVRHSDQRRSDVPLQAAWGISRRAVLAAPPLLGLTGLSSGSTPAAAAEQPSADALQVQDRLDSSDSASTSGMPHLPNYFEPGPFEVRRLPKLEHCASSIFPFCVGNRCMLRISVLYPKGLGKGAPGVLQRHLPVCWHVWRS